MTTLFLDTSFVIALELVDEQYHDRAIDCWRGLSRGSPRLVTTSYVFDEIVTFFNSRNRHDKAIEIGDRLLSSSVIELIHVDQDLFSEAWQHFKQHSDKSYSLTDCISFLVMTRLNLQSALSLDRHFAQAGFQKLP